MSDEEEISEQVSSRRMSPIQAYKKAEVNPFEIEALLLKGDHEAMERARLPWVKRPKRDKKGKVIQGEYIWHWDHPLTQSQYLSLLKDSKEFLFAKKSSKSSPVKPRTKAPPKLPKPKEEPKKEEEVFGTATVEIPK